MKKLILILLALVGSAQAQSLRHYETKYVSVTPTVTAALYTAKDDVGGLMTFSNITCQNMQKGELVGVIVSDKADNAVEYNVIIFNTTPAGTITDKTTFDPSDADLLLMNPIINLATTDHFSWSDNGISSLSSLGSVAKSANATGYLPGNFYVALQTPGTPTYASTSDITVTLAFRCD